MSLNWREIALILSELQLQKSIIQKVHQIEFHGLIFELHHPQERAWKLYVEVGTDKGRIHRIESTFQSLKSTKTPKLQRFIQYMRSHIEGSRIISVEQLVPDRLVIFHLMKHQMERKLIIRLYSGPKANVIICDEHYTILELLFRRPKQQEMPKEHLQLPQSMPYSEDNRFPIRERDPRLSFNQYIEKEYAAKPIEHDKEIIERIIALRDQELSSLSKQLAHIQKNIEYASHYDHYRVAGDLLSSHMHAIEPHMKWITVDNFYAKDESTSTIELDPTCNASQNIEAYYQKYRKGKATFEHLNAQLLAVQKKKKLLQHEFQHLLDPSTDIAVLQQYLSQKQVQKTPHTTAYAKAPGLCFTSGLFTLLVGRNAKENDELLRSWTKGNDWWVHTRDTPGGYVFIKHIAQKSIPLETLLDAANLALLFSKAKEARKGSLYVTQVKYLRRLKGGKTGLVIPTQEKNIDIELDDNRIQRLFSEGKETQSVEE